MKRDRRLALAAIDDTGRDRLDRYARLLAERAVPLGFVSASDRERLMDRHVLDSLRVVPCIERDESHLADVGSGAGLPGIPLAIALPDRMVTLIEPMRRRAAFLELAVNDLELRNVTVVIERAEHASIVADVCVMRAVVSPESAWAMARHVLRPGGRALVFAGRAFDPGRAPLGTGVLVEECSKARHGVSGPVIIMREGAGPSGSPSEG